MPGLQLGLSRPGRRTLFPFGKHVYGATRAALGPLKDAKTQAFKDKSKRFNFMVASTSHGLGNAAGTGSNGLVGAGPLCYTSQARDALQALGLNFRWDSHMGGHRIDTQLNAWLSRLIIGANFGPTGADTALQPGGDKTRNGTSGSTSCIRLTPSHAANAMILWDLIMSGGPATAAQLSYGGDYTADVLTLETVLGASLSQSNATLAVRKSTRSTGGQAAIQPFNFKRTAASTAVVYFLGMLLHDTANPDIGFINISQAGAPSAWLAQTGNVYSPLTMLSSIGDICGVTTNATTNDILTGVNPNTTYANLQAIITAYQALGATVILETSSPISTVTGPATQNAQETMRQAVLDLRASNSNVIAIDRFMEFGGSYAIANGAGLMGDINHPNAAGQALMARALTRLLEAA